MKPQRILLADDDPKLLALLKSSLQKEGYVILEVLDGEAALDQIKSEKHGAVKWILNRGRLTSSCRRRHLKILVYPGHIIVFINQCFMEQ